MRRPLWYQLAALTALSAGLYVVLLYADLAASAPLAALVSGAALAVADQVRTLDAMVTAMGYPETAPGDHPGVVRSGPCGSCSWGTASRPATTCRA